MAGHPDKQNAGRGTARNCPRHGIGLADWTARIGHCENDPSEHRQQGLDLYHAGKDGKTENIYLATTKTGIPFTDNWLRKELSEWTAKLGYPGHSTHGLRKNAVIYLLTAGCTTRATAETVEMSDAMVNHYSKELNSQILADESINKLAEHDMFR